MNKTERLSRQLDELEREYRELLIRALNGCAGGRWGLFGHNEHLHLNHVPPDLVELRELAGAISRVRNRIGMAPFPLHEAFEAARGRSKPNAVGEPKQAEAWLRQLSRA
jgi:hypothetical protein